MVCFELHRYSSVLLFSLLIAIKSLWIDAELISRSKQQTNSLDSYTAINLRRQQQSSKNCLLSSLVGVAALVDSCPCVPSVSVPSLAGLAVLRGLSCAAPGTIQYCFEQYGYACLSNV